MPLVFLSLVAVTFRMLSTYETSTLRTLTLPGCICVVVVVGGGGGGGGVEGGREGGKDGEREGGREGEREGDGEWEGSKEGDRENMGQYPCRNQTGTL